jgi:hypothetical protein
MGHACRVFISKTNMDQNKNYLQGELGTFWGVLKSVSVPTSVHAFLSFRRSLLVREAAVVSRNAGAPTTYVGFLLLPFSV